MDVRIEGPDDAPAIRKVLIEAFPGVDEANLVESLRAANRLSISLVAVESDRIAGYVAFSPVSLENTPDGLGIAPLAILPEFQHRGVGSLLVGRGLEAAAAIGAGYVAVLGDPEYYARFGFRRASALGLGNEYGADDAFMVLELKPGTLPTKGVIRFGPEFGAWS